MRFLAQSNRAVRNPGSSERAFTASILATLLAALTACGGSLSTTTPGAPAQVRPVPPVRTPNASAYTFQTVDDQADPSFNEILGIDDGARITGFYGSGTTSDPSVGYIVTPPYGPNNFRKLEYPGAADTDVTGLNDTRTIVGFYRDTENDIAGFVFVRGIWTTVKHPHGMPNHKSVTELLGVNNEDVAVGYYTDPSGVNEAFSYDVATGKFRALSPPSASGAIATGISGRGDIVGYVQKKSHSVGFLLRQGTYTELSHPGAADTEFLGVTVYDQIVGSYSGSSGATHGFLLTNPLKPSIAWQLIDEPNAAGTTVVTGINQRDDIVGYYVDSAGNTNGFFASPK